MINQNPELYFPGRTHGTYHFQNHRSSAQDYCRLYAGPISFSRRLGLPVGRPRLLLVRFLRLSRGAVRCGQVEYYGTTARRSNNHKMRQLLAHLVSVNILHDHGESVFERTYVP
jgi:hypothetical protein